MSYQLINDRRSPNHGYDPEGRHGDNIPVEIIIHHFGSDESTFEGTANWLCNPASGVSAHDVATAGLVEHILDYDDSAYHSGRKYNNMRSIAIECNPRCSNEDFETVAELISNIWRQVGKKLPLRGHKNIVSTQCPGRWYPRLKELYNRAEFYYDGFEPILRIEVDGIWGHDTSLATQIKLGVQWRDGILSDQFRDNIGECIVRSAIHSSGWDFVGYVSNYGSDTVRAIQRLVGCPVDGVLGPDTIRHMQKFLGVTVDGIMGYNTVSAWQRWLNAA